MFIQTQRGTFSPGFLTSVFCIVSVLASCLFVPSYSHAAENSGKDVFRKGRQLFESGQFEQAMPLLSLAQQEYSLLADYALLYLADSLHNLGAHEKALISARALIEKFPSSLLIRKAKQTELREMAECEKDSVGQAFEKYAREYPDDEETLFFYAEFLKKEGDTVRSKALMKQIYRKGGTHFSQALAELKESDISVSDMLELSANLMKRFDFDAAEQELRKALSLDRGEYQAEIRKNLAYALFKQKKYRDAASLYGKIHDTYFMARSLYRAGDHEAFRDALSELIARDDKRAGYLLLTVAADRRRERDFEKAFATYADILSKYPSETEEALWGTGWTHYLKGEYGKASEVFERLHTRFNEPKYLYWQARSMEAEGKEASQLYQSLSKAENNYYGFLASLKSRPALRHVSYRPSDPLSQSRPACSDRIEALQSLSMQKEAVAEILHSSKKVDSPGEILFFMEKLHEFGEYRREIGLAARLPYSERLHRFWYPLGFQEVVEPVAEKFGFDPFITLSVIREESRFDPEAISPAGARGLMQLMPQTAFKLDKKLKLGIRRNAQIHDINNNITLGTYYLKSLFSEFSSLTHVIAAYNAGEAAVRKWQQANADRSADEFIEEIPYSETRNYVKKVLTSYFQYRKFAADASDSLGTDLFSRKR